MFHGTFTALISPFTSDGGAVDLERLEANIADQAEGGASGVVACGTTGETPTLAAAEYHAVVERTIEAARRHQLMAVVGAGSNSTAAAIDHHKAAHTAGAEAALHVCPYYNKPSQEGLYRHFTAIADACDLPVILYNIPGRCGVGLTLETIHRLAGHENIRAVKEASGSLTFASAIRRTTDLQVLSGDDPLTLPLMALGATGVISVLSNALPGPVSSMCSAAAAGRFDEARSIHEQLLPLAEALLTLDTNPVPIKTAMALMGTDTGAVRLPLVAASPTVRTRLAELLESCGAELPGMTLPYKLAVLCYVYDDRGRLLLLHRNKAPNAGMYSPIGGKIETTRGESPHDCAVREIQEEAGLELDHDDVRLCGMVAETAYEGENHWLIFLFEVTHPIDPRRIELMQIDEGNLEWVPVEEVAGLPIPETDLRIMWPLTREHRGGFFAVHIDCSGGELCWTVQESWGKKARRHEGTEARREGVGD